jgi:hypothetical protein
MRVTDDMYRRGESCDLQGTIELWQRRYRGTLKPPRETACAGKDKGKQGSKNDCSLRTAL